MDTKVADPLNGALLGGRYRIMGRLARGGVATVYQARDERLERVVAVKLIHPNDARDPIFLDRLTDEAKTVARLAHPNVVAVYDQGVHDGAPYLVMEYVRGRSLREVLDDRGRLDPNESLAILEQILAALTGAHRAGLVHRDVRPENILVAPPPNGSGDLVDAVVKVADFGFAHAIEISGRRGGERGAPAEYVAPELAADGRADPRADIYSAGVIFAEMLTGQGPPPGEEVRPPSRVVPGLPYLLDEVVVRATRRDPADRPRDAQALLTLVQTAREDVGALTGPTRALAHPTVAVPTVNDARPSWARLPTGRRPAPRRQPPAQRSAPGPPPPPGAGPLAAARGALAQAGRSLQGAGNSVMGRVDGMRATTKGRRKLIAAIVAVVVIVGGGTWWFGFGRYVDAPSLVQLTKGDAIVQAARQGFTVAYGPGRYEETIPLDTVLDQRPEPGDRILPGGTLTLTLSLGPERYAVPDVTGQASDFATERLKELFVVRNGDGFSDNLPPGYVVGTDPAPGTLLKKGAPVTLLIAKGPYPVHVPTVVGKLRAEVEPQLKGMGFDVEVQVKEDQSKPHDMVLDQNPPGGQGLATAKGTKIVLTVASGPPGTPMPTLIGTNCHNTVEALRGAGYQVSVNVEGPAQFVFNVQAQSPNPNEPLQPGQAISLQCGP
jgi:serine/threonine-protein kinase